MKRLIVFALLFPAFFCVSQAAASDSQDGMVTEAPFAYAYYAGAGGYELWYDAGKMEPAPSEYACDAFLPLDAEANPGVSFAVYEIGYASAIALPGAADGEPDVLQVPELAEVYSAGEAFPAVIYAFEEAGYTLVEEEDNLSSGDFGTAYALYLKDGMLVSLRIAEFAAGTFLTAVTYPQETEDSWGAWLAEMADSFAAAPGL